MAGDVLTEVVIDRPVDAVAEYVGDPSNAPEWYANIESVNWQPQPPVGVGSRMTLRNRGKPSGFAGVAAPLMAASMRRANAKDLDRLKHLLESR